MMVRLMPARVEPGDGKFHPFNAAQE